MRARATVLLTATALLLLTGGAASADSVIHAGPRGDGTAVTPAGFLVTPAGAQTTLGGLPLGAAASPDGGHLLVSNDGQGTQSLQVVDSDDGDVIQTIAYPAPEALFFGVAYSPDGHKAYASAGGNNKVRTYTVDGQGKLTEGAPLPLPTTNPAGQPVNLFPSGLAVSPDGATVYVADQLGDAFTAIDVATGATSTVPVGHNPMSVLLSKDGHTAYVTNQGADTLSVVDTRTLIITSTVAVGTHPNREILDTRRGLLYVSASDSDSIAVLDTRTNRVVRTFDVSPYRGAPVGSNPIGLALSPDGNTLYVANSGNNDVALVDTRQGRTTAMIPTGWYPTALSLSRDGHQLSILNAKGLGAGPNTGPGQPDPYHPATSPDKYVGSMMKGTLSRVTLSGWKATLADWSRQVVRNNGFDERDRVRVAGRPGGVIPMHVGDRSPIKHVIYIVKENRTYDQEFGSLGKGAGDPGINLFGDESAPNSRALARQFVTLDNFYADAEISAQGWNWSVAANSNPYVEQAWPANYSGRNRGYDFEGGNPATAPGRQFGSSYIWQRLVDAGVSVRNYGFYADPQGRTAPNDLTLQAITDHAYPGYDLSKADHCGTEPPFTTGRMCEWLREFQGYVSTGTLPSVELVRLPNDHTAGTRPGAPVPKSYVADNDYALGQLVDAVTHSPYWKDTAVFVTEDDAQNGPDHIDAHRTLALAISPYTQHGRVDSTFYSTVSMLRTIELIVGLRPLTQFDAFAHPMLASFSDRPDRTPFSAILPTQPFLELNTAASPMAAQSAQQDLSAEDRIDMDVFNQAIWKSVKGADSQMPAPVHRLGSGRVPEDDDD